MKPKKDYIPLVTDFQNGATSFFIGMGLGAMAASVPIFNGAAKQKKRREQSLELARSQMTP